VTAGPFIAATGDEADSAGRPVGERRPQTYSDHKGFWTYDKVDRAVPARYSIQTSRWGHRDPPNRQSPTPFGLRLYSPNPRASATTPSSSALNKILIGAQQISQS